MNNIDGNLHVNGELEVSKTTSLFDNLSLHRMLILKIWV